LLRQDGAAQPRASTNRNTAVAIFAIQNKRNRGQRLRVFTIFEMLSPTTVFFGG
jgi:hypothetical protein